MILIKEPWTRPIIKGKFGDIGNEYTRPAMSIPMTLFGLNIPQQCVTPPLSRPY